MIDNNNIETFSRNNPFLFDEINDSNIGVSFDKESANTGDIVCVTSLYNELIHRFGSYENAKLIYGFAKDAIVAGNYSNYSTESDPYLNFTVYLEQTIIDEGILTPYVRKWVPGEKYYIGDTVYYSMDGSDENMKTYVLVESSTEYDGDSDYVPVTEKIEIPYSVYEANYSDYDGNSWENRKYYLEEYGKCYIEENEKYYIEIGYYRGYYDEKTRLTYFDTINSDGTLSLDHWEESIATNINNDRDYSGITGTTESLLRNVTRRKTDMDISGNTLPFILHYNDIYNPSTGVKTGRELDIDKTEMFYMCGNVNMDYDFDSGKVVSDVLESVTFYSSDSVPESGISFTDVNKPIVITADKEAYTDSGSQYPISGYNMVQFVYYSSATLISSGTGSDEWIRKDNTGVKYVERRPMTIQTSDFIIEINDDSSAQLQLTYIDINSNTQSETDYGNIDAINALRSNVNYSTITVDRGQLGDDYFLSAITFKDETTMGVQNIKSEIDVNIERGIAESFQKHNMLGEICTLQDLENYKNGRYLE